MFSRLVRWQLTVFTVFTVISVSYVAANYVDIGRWFNYGTYHVTVQLANTGGLYHNAIVTYHGVQVGRVREVTPTRAGVAADLRINKKTRIPADLTAEVRATSPVGEQYIDLKPRGAAPGPMLADGSVIPAEHTVLPIPTTELLDSANALLASLPRSSYQTTVSEMGAATNGTGAAMRTLLDSSLDLVTAAQWDVTPTIALINQLMPFTTDQLASGTDIRVSLRNLGRFSERLAASDGQIRSILDQTPGAARSVDEFVDALRGPLPNLLDNVGALGEVPRVFLPSVRQLLVLVPIDIEMLQSTVGGSVRDIHAVRVNFKATLNDPPYCAKGYERGDSRDPADLRPIPPREGLYCREAPSSPLAVRGARNSLCPDGQRRAATAEGCGLRFVEPQVRRRDVAPSEGNPHKGPN